MSRLVGGGGVATLATPVGRARNHVHSCSRRTNCTQWTAEYKLFRSVLFRCSAVQATQAAQLDFETADCGHPIQIARASGYYRVVSGEFLISPGVLVYSVAAIIRFTAGFASAQVTSSTRSLQKVNE